MENWISQLTKARQAQRTFALCTLINVEGSFGRPPGARMLVFEDGSTQGTIGGGPVELEVIKTAKAFLKETKNGMFEMQNPETGTRLTFFIESFQPDSELVIFGAGHVARALVYFARKLEFSITVVDERAEMLADPAFAGINTKAMHHPEFLKGFEPGPRHFLVLCSHRHDYDFEILAQLNNKPWAYLGMIGNRKKISEAKEFLLQRNAFDEAAFAKVDSPIGIKLPGKSPEIIGLSIAARLIEVKNQA
ncbi:MAG: XdhC family protein [Bacteroidales bacterium]|nr:XdhC family protein [Bacteroidales bacterium]